MTVAGNVMKNMIVFCAAWENKLWERELNDSFIVDWSRYYYQYFERLNDLSLERTESLSALETSTAVRLEPCETLHCIDVQT
jgi:hypothetical protein